MNGIEPTRDLFARSPTPIEGYLRRLFPDLGAQVVFDIGSCEGEDAIRYAALFPSATVYAFEPLPENVVILEGNLRRHGNPNVRVFDIALSDEPGRAALHVSSGSPDGVAPVDWDYGNKSSSLLRPDRHLDIHPWVRFEREIEVETDTIERICRKEAIEQIDLVHLDVQGAELKVLAGAGSYLSRIGAIWLEVEAVSLYEDQPLKADVERFMAEHGFRQMLSTVDSVSGDQLYFNPRIVRPLGARLSLGKVSRFATISTARAKSTIRVGLRRIPRLGRVVPRRVARYVWIRTLRRLLLGLSARMSGRLGYQSLFEALHRLSLAGMNMGAAADHPSTSGEWVVMKHLPRSPVIFDVGANIGEYATMVLKARPDARLWCFEPSKVAYSELSRRLAGKAVVLPIGLGDAEAEVDLFAPAVGSALGSAYRREHPSVEFRATERVQFRRLDDVCDELAIMKIDLLKLDVEGHELAVLHGAQRTLQAGGIDIVQFEFGGSNVDSRTFVRDFFDLFGSSYLIHRILRDGLVPIAYHELREVFTTTNYVAIRKTLDNRVDE